MDLIIAGSAVGMLFASLSTAFGSMILFWIARNPGPKMKLFFEKIPPSRLVFPSIVMLHPIGIALGIFFAILFSDFEHRYPSDGFASPNLVYTGLIMGLGILIFSAPAVIFRLIWMLILMLGISFVLTFGWILPYLVL